MTSYILYEITEKTGKLNGSKIYTLQWIDVDTLQQYEMIVDSTYRNFNYWQEIIFGDWCGVYTNLKRSLRQTVKKKNVLDADSKAQMTEVLTMEDVMRYVQYKSKPKQSNFDNLFEFEIYPA